MRLIYSLILFICFTSTAFGQSMVTGNPRLIEVDAGRNKGALNRSYQLCVGAGRANEGLRADWQRQLTYLQAQCGFKYIRFHGLLSDDMGVYREDKQGNAIYNWQYIDELFDFLLRIKMKPFVEIGFMPSALASGDKTIFWWKGNTTPPKDYQKWDALIKNMVAHWAERYGHAEVKSWYFEIWNEPNLRGFFDGDQQQYFKLYHETATTIKSLSADYRVGGPATAGNSWIADMINYCISTKTPIDFISTHDYGVKQGFLDQTGDVGTVVSQDRAAVYGNMINTRRIISASVMPNLELHYTEWSSSYTPTDPIHDSYHEAAYILDKIKHASPHVNSMSYWTFTDIFEEMGPRMTPFHGGFGLINYQDIKKPAFYAYRFLNKLSDTEISSSDTSSIATSDKRGNVQLLFWNFSITHPGDSVNNQTYYKRDLPAKAISPAKVKINHLKAGTYQLQVYKIGYRANDAYATYLDLKSPSQLTRQQVAQIKQANNGEPEISSTIKIGASGSFEKVLPMRQNDVYLVTLQLLKH